MFVRTRFKLVVYIILFIIGMSILTWWVMFNKAKSRDHERLADMKVLQSQFSLYYSKFNTYQVADCLADTLVSDCRGQSADVIGLSGFVDPVGSGSYQYVLRSLSEDDFIISFSLESGIGGLPSGTYYMTKNGVKTQ